MIIITHFTSQIVPVALSFGVSYWLFVTADKFNTRLKPIGETLSWTLITLTLISLLYSFFYSMTLTDKEYMRNNCPVIKIIEQQEQPLVEGQQPDDMNNGQNADDNQDTDDEGNGGINDQLHETYTPGQGRPVQKTSEDH